MLMEMPSNPLYTIDDPSDCLSHNSKLWIPVILGSYSSDHGEYCWFDDRLRFEGNIIQKPNFPSSQPNGKGIDRCVGLMGKTKAEYFWNDRSCTDSPTCSACSIPVAQTYYLRGPDMFDHIYSLSWNMQTENSSEVIFEGQGSSQIVWYPLKERTEIKLLKGKRETFSFEQNPFGLLSNATTGNGFEQLNQWVFTNVRYTLHNW